MSETLRKRVLTAVVLGAALLAILLWLPDWATVAVVTLMVLFGAWEWSAFLLLVAPGPRLAYVGLVGMLLWLVWRFSSTPGRRDLILALAVHPTHPGSVNVNTIGFKGERITLKDYRGQLRQVTVIDLGHEEPTVLLTNNFRIGCSALVTRYAQRMLIENGIAEAIQFFHLDALSSMVGLRVDFDLQITLMASSLYRLMAEHLDGIYQHAEAKTIFHNVLDVGASVTITENEVIVRLDKRAHNPFLVASRLADQPTPMPWFGHKQLSIRFP